MRCIITLLVSLLFVSSVVDAQTRFRAPWTSRIAAMFDGPAARDVAIDVDGNVWRYSAGERTWSWRPASYPKNICRGISMAPETGAVITKDDSVFCISLTESVLRWKMHIPSVRDIDTQNQKVVMYVGDSIITLNYDGSFVRHERIPDAVKVRYAPTSTTWITSTRRLVRSTSGGVRSESIPVLDSIRSVYLDDTIAVIVTSSACCVVAVSQERFGQLQWYFGLPDSSVTDDVSVLRLSPDEFMTSLVINGIRKPCLVNITRGTCQTEFYPNSPLDSDLPLVFASPTPTNIQMGFGSHAGIVRIHYHSTIKKYRILNQSVSGEYDSILDYRRLYDGNEIAVMECRPPFIPHADYSQIVIVSRHSGRLRWWSIVENTPSQATYAIESHDVVVRKLANEHMLIDSTGMRTVLKPPSAETMYATLDMAMALLGRLMVSTNDGVSWNEVQDVPGVPLDINYLHPLGFLVHCNVVGYGQRWYSYSHGAFRHIPMLAQATTMAFDMSQSKVLVVAAAAKHEGPKLLVLQRDDDVYRQVTLETLQSHVVQPQAHFDGKALVSSARDYRYPPSIQLKVYRGEATSELYSTDEAWKHVPIVGIGVDQDSIYIVYKSTDIISKPRLSTTTGHPPTNGSTELRPVQLCYVYSTDGGRSIVVPSHAEVTVLDVTGRIISCKLYQREESTIVDTELLPAGVYFLHVVTTDFCQTVMPIVKSR
ncbi:MAG TPA: hypothetical protein DIS79_10695 [Bacteroidetes bacterium]|nr:hypothetical protein [Bacteroidota bacterium]